MLQCRLLGRTSRLRGICEGANCINCLHDYFYILQPASRPRRQPKVLLKGSGFAVPGTTYTLAITSVSAGSDGWQCRVLRHCFLCNCVQLAGWADWQVACGSDSGSWECGFGAVSAGFQPGACESLGRRLAAHC